MRLSGYITTLSVSASLALALAAGSASAQSLPPPFASYAAKFSCGVATVDADVVKGTYATSVNIHNPQAQTTVVFFKKLVVANEEGQPFGKIVVLTQAALESLPPDLAERVDCPLIMSKLGLTGGHVEGFVVIQVGPQGSTNPTIPLLDVEAKYTARTRASGFDVVPYSPTLITK
jgi:hypothetical protein